MAIPTPTLKYQVVMRLISKAEDAVERNEQNIATNEIPGDIFNTREEAIKNITSWDMTDLSKIEYPCCVAAWVREVYVFEKP